LLPEEKDAWKKGGIGKDVARGKNEGVSTIWKERKPKINGGGKARAHKGPRNSFHYRGQKGGDKKLASKLHAHKRTKTWHEEAG